MIRRKRVLEAAEHRTVSRAINFGLDPWPNDISRPLFGRTIRT
jgi:hypothetical protein